MLILKVATEVKHATRRVFNWDKSKSISGIVTLKRTINNCVLN